MILTIFITILHSLVDDVLTFIENGIQDENMGIFIFLVHDNLRGKSEDEKQCSRTLTTLGWEEKKNGAREITPGKRICFFFFFSSQRCMEEEGRKMKITLEPTAGTCMQG